MAGIDMLLMVEKVIKEEYVTIFIDMQKLLTIKYTKDYDNNKESKWHSILGYKWFIWLGNVAKVSSKKFWIDQRYFSI